MFNRYNIKQNYKMAWRYLYLLSKLWRKGHVYSMLKRR